MERDSGRELSNLGMVIAKAENIALLERTGLRRAEFVLFDPADREPLRGFLRDAAIRFSAHVPFFNPVDPPEHPLLACVMDADEERRRRSMALVRATMEDAAEFGAEYVVVHLQRVSHFSRDAVEEIDAAEFRDSLWRSCEELDRWTAELGVGVCLENLFSHSMFYDLASYREIFQRHPSLRFCLDIGHLDMDSRAFGVDFMEFIRGMMPHLRAVHLQNSKGGEFRQGHRHWKAPVHESQNPADGWRDIPAILAEIICARPETVINFESWPDYYPTRDYMMDGIQWMKGVYAGILEDALNGKADTTNE